jgi:hypothetical protein
MAPLDPHHRHARAQRQILALLDKARSTPFEAEAEAATTKAFEMMARHHIDEAVLDARRAADDPARIVEDRVDLGRGAYVNGRLSLLANICEALSVRCLTSSGVDGRVGHVIGHGTDVADALLLYGSLHAQAAARMAATTVAKRSGRGHTAAVVRFRRSFLFGFAATVGERLAAAGEAARAQVPDSTALVLADRSARVDEWVDTNYGRLSTHRASGAGSTNGWAAGSQAATEADIRTGRGGAVSGPAKALRR